MQSRMGSSALFYECLEVPDKKVIGSQMFA